MKARILASALAFTALSTTAFADERVLSIGGSITEIVYALGEEDRLIARDTTSSFPAVVEELPDVGYMRALSPEGVLSVDPTLIIAEAGSGPLETIEVLEGANIPFITIPDGFDRPAVATKIQAVAQALGVPEKGEELAAEIDAQLAALETSVDAPARVMFILSTQGGRIMASGTNTAADGIIALAGGTNAVTGFEGYNPLTDEAVTLAAPDVIVMMAREGDHNTADADLWAHPAISTTPAAQTQSIVRMNGLLLLGFGPRTPEAAQALHSALYDEG
ncbi:iron complex transport system substrate-binding protein [Octadecabacter temperatus]|uniref:Hemin-binding periplasmic protein HmuT n=1 Tax=Octadecabacter temperatus TaxID=1458307 RepID=A0A0K0Y684_9RHOB|nr:ABC transporter substrate-binding protein [Octadecabacter temperatus]AKS46352.1 Hemin-binding periplasmic protein HmuT precursor [Octadecabacter temperatus]SIO12402.1 iron complex transport system substrate-binding protein [Octadecabacter temperatus]